MYRIRGKVGQATEPPEYAGKWFFQMWLSPLGSGDVKPEESLGEFGPWDTEGIAQSELSKAARVASEALEKAETGKVGGAYIDMKTNLLRYWDKRNEH